jgi:ribonucleoside-diphosphate reductase beta chain
MESNEELVTMKPESEGVDPATSANGALVEIEEALTQDFSNFTKQDYVDLLKDLAHQNDHRKTEAVLREIKSRYDELLDKERQEALKKFVDEVVQTEFTWNEYLFSEGRKVVGLTKDLLDDWIKWNAQVVYDFLGLELPFERITENPLLWMDDWFDIDVIQNANQEADNTNYKLNSVVYTLSDDEILDF